MKKVFQKYFEIFAFGSGIILLALMDPATVTGPSLCLFDQLGISFCAGEGLGHSISYTFRGQFRNALEANILGPPAIAILGGRMVHLIRTNHKNNIL